MSEALEFLGPALAMCLVIASLHVYLGMHILEREVIFVDLSLAQLAALGATVGTVMVAGEGEGGHEHDGDLLAFGFTAFGAALFSLAGRAREHVSLEAIVGIVYAVATAAMVLVLSDSPHGGEHIKDILTGSLLLTTWEQVWTALGAYAVIGGVHLLLARRFVSLSWAAESTSSAAWWDFGFYLLFGVVITLSVQAAGILVVFSFLIVPAVITKLFSTRLLVRLVAGWAVALTATVLGLWASWSWDLPTGATVVAAFGALVVVAALIRLARPGRAG